MGSMIFIPMSCNVLRAPSPLKQDGNLWMVRPKPKQPTTTLDCHTSIPCMDATSESTTFVLKLHQNHGLAVLVARPQIPGSCQYLKTCLTNYPLKFSQPLSKLEIARPVGETNGKPS